MKEYNERSDKMGTILCIECGAADTYELKDIVREYEGDGYHFEMLVTIPFCKICGAPIYDEELESKIAQKANKKIREQRHIITREEILEILKAYNISQKFLSKALGWGEITLTRYISGNYTPNISNSNRLKELKNPYIFQMLLQDYCEEHRTEHEEKAIKKAQNSTFYQLNELKNIQGKIFDVVNWFLSQASDEAPVTHLALQKLLYFTQSWSMALLDKAIFCDNCQAWAHGAVYPNVYVYFRWFKFKPLPKINKISAFNEKELKILNAVKSYYFDIYSPKALEEICHCEEPYKRARKEHVEGEMCNTVIDKKHILYYYQYISEKYNIDLDDMTNIKKYLNVLLSYGNCLSNC